jgi:serine/threonine protein kinase
MQDDIKDNKDIKDIREEIVKIFNINLNDIKQIGQGSYSKVYKINDNQVVKISNRPKAFRTANIKEYDYLQHGTFRELFFNPILTQKNLLQFEKIVHDDNIGFCCLAPAMKGDINDDDFFKIFNEDIFFDLLSDMTNALLHLHSHGLIHSDIKPANILYNYDENNKIYFKLCDFNITQFCSSDLPRIKIYATYNYYVEEKRSFGLDIHMLGATILVIIGFKDGILIDESQIDLDTVEKYKDIIIKFTSDLCYKILRMMMLPRKNRIYLDDLFTYIKYRKYREIKNSDLDFNENIDRIYKNNQYIAQVSHYFYENMNENEKREYSKITENIYIKNVSTKRYSIKDVDIISCALAKIIQDTLEIDLSIAEYIGQEISYFQNSVDQYEWIKINKNISFENINCATFAICMIGLKINYHYLICSQCNKIDFGLFPNMLNENNICHEFEIFNN